MASSSTAQFHDIPGVPNFRDVGGYPIASKPGYEVRRNLIFRSSEPSKITADGISKVNKLGITRVYDLRSLNEIKPVGEPDPGQTVVVWDGAERILVPVFMDQDHSPQALAARYRAVSESTTGFVGGYKEILDSAVAGNNRYQPFRTILRHLASRDHAPILIHCTGGKDRTGVLSALILSFCGVEDDMVAYEYSLTNVGLAARKEELLKYLTMHEPFKNNHAAAERLFEARVENMLATLAMFRKSFGSVENYIVEKCGLSIAEVEQLRRNLVVESARD